MGFATHVGGPQTNEDDQVWGKRNLRFRILGIGER